MKLLSDSQPRIESFSELRVLVMGLGRFGGGVGVTRWLAGQGASVTVADQASADSLRDSLAEISDLSVELRFGPHQESDLDRIDLVIVNPAVKKSSSNFFQLIKKRGTPWTTEMNLFCERCPAPMYAVTGTFGKSTTCAMLAKVLQDGGREAGIERVHLGGNIGRSLLSELSEIRCGDAVVLEMSNAQLEDIPLVAWSPRFAVITNLHPHHLDRYESSDDYFHAKFNLLRSGQGLQATIIGELHPRAEELLRASTAKSANRVVRIATAEPPIELTIPGDHNQQNAACVWTTAREIGISDASIRESLRTFRGLEHRLEFVRNMNGVSYYNDSKSTAPTATIVALRALAHDRRIICIIGGQRKDAPLAECAMVLNECCRATVCMGESGPDFASAVRTYAPAADVLECNALPEAVDRGRSIAQPGDIVLFSPGAPSFDQYVNFTERGRHFVELVHQL
ncbi:MAG: UDP-N-acetylmuramoyl-L-alanine--D-glutamate ligase [Planctomycetes bacterium]|nr:UDP-N-acetylmuramoyl-L-alanine--D-glutamate ligase [Planctomycetota bacterium]